MFRVFLFCAIITFSKSNANDVFQNEEYTLKENLRSLCILNEPIILHSAFEGPNAIVGGLGSVVSSLNSFFSKKIYNCFIITPYYGFLKNVFDDDHVLSLGFFHHMVFGKQKRTEVFYNYNQKQFLFTPDPTLTDILSIVDDSYKIYESTHNYSRIVYFGSAIAKFADLIDASIVHQHAWQTALIAPIIQKIYNPIRQSKEKKEIKVISTIHMLSEEQGIDSRSLYDDVGLTTNETNIVNLTATSILESDHLTTVSKGLVHEFYNPKTSFGLSDLFIQKKHYITGITNGIDYKKYSPFLIENYGNLHLENNFSIEELALCKKNAKQILADYNLISSNEKPLLLYVGRLSTEKGVEFLEPIIEPWLKMGGQMVVMGILTSDKNAQNIIFNLQQNIDFSDNLKIYTDLHNDQFAQISPETKIEKGKLLRLAADFACIPSKVEACGLTAMELLSVGTPIFTSWVQGLKDFCFPLDVDHPILNTIIDEENFNTISYQYFSEDKNKTIEDLHKQLFLAYNIASGNHINPECLLMAQKKMILASKCFDWLSFQGALDQYVDLYNHTINASLDIRGREPEFLSMNWHFNKLISKKVQLYPKNQMIFQDKKYPTFTLITTTYPIREPESKYNRPNLENETLLNVKENKIYLNENLFDTDEMKKNNADFYVTWVLDKKGNIYAGAQCHAYYLKSKPGKPFYGYAKPIACGGDFIVKKGKITYIDNRSGHYKPTIGQFKEVLTYFYSLGILSENCEIKLEQTAETIPINNGYF